MPSGPGWLVARVSIMKLVGAARRRTSGSSGCSGMNTVPPPLVTRSRPWSKNCPKSVNIELNGAERPTSGATFGMNSVPVLRHLRGLTGGGDRGRVGRGLVHDQVAGHARAGVDDRSRLLGVAGAAVGAAELRRRRPREDGVGCAELLLAGDQVVAGAVDGPQAPGQVDALLVAVGDLVRPGAEQRAARLLGRSGGRMRLGDGDLPEDEPQVGPVEVEALADRGRMGSRRQEDRHPEDGDDHRQDHAQEDPATRPL